MRVRGYAAGLLVSALLLAGCSAGGNHEGRGVDVVLSEPATAVTAAPGDTITLRLAENASTGHVWDFVAPLPDGIVMLESRYEEEPAPTDGSGAVMTGVGGTRVLRLRCDRAASEELDLALSPAWDRAHPVDRKRVALTCQ